MSFNPPFEEEQQQVPAGTVFGNMNKTLSYSKYEDNLKIGKFAEFLDVIGFHEVINYQNNLLPNNYPQIGVVLNNVSYPPKITVIGDDSFEPNKKPSVVNIIYKGFVTVYVKPLDAPKPFDDVYISSQVGFEGMASTTSGPPSLFQNANAKFIREIPTNDVSTKIWLINLK